MLDPSESVSLHCLKEKQKKLFCRDRSAVSWRSSRGQPSEPKAGGWGVRGSGEASLDRRHRVSFTLRKSTGRKDIESRLMDMGRVGERARCVERVTWKLTLPYVK